jgi:hypothetical protein
MAQFSPASDYLDLLDPNILILSNLIPHFLPSEERDRVSDPYQSPVVLNLHFIYLHCNI